jgi:hypothetical protein
MLCTDFGVTVIRSASRVAVASWGPSVNIEPRSVSFVDVVLQPPVRLQGLG